MKLFNELQASIAGMVENFYWDIGVDLGTSNTLIYLKDRGIVIDEPTMMARLKKKRWLGLSAPSNQGGRAVAYGYKAKEMFNREPMHIEVVAPLQNGIVSDMEALEMLLNYYLKLIYEVPGKSFKIFKPRVTVSVPSMITEVQKRAVRTLFLSAGASEVLLVENLVLAALGLGMGVDDTAGLMVVDMGGGKTEVGLVSAGGIVVGRGIKTSGEDLDGAIVNYVRMKYGLLIGRVSAEKAKIDIGSVLEKTDEKSTVLRGRDMETGLPKTVRITSMELREAMIMEVGKTIKLVKEILDETPPELMDDVLKRGIMLTGNGAKLEGIKKMMEAELRVSVELVEEPGLAVIKGIGVLMEDPKVLEKIKVVTGIGR